jgi:hypothetical protein
VGSTKQSAPRDNNASLTKQGKKSIADRAAKTRAQKHQSMTWAQKLKRFLTSALKPLSNAVVRLTL